MRHATPLLVMGLLLAALVLGGCGSVTKRPGIDDVEVAAEASRMYEMVVGRDQTHLRRLADLGTPLLIGNADLCGVRTRYTIALGVHNLEDYRGRRRDAMESVYELDEKIRVTIVGKEGPAHIAGLREGDAILAVNDIETPRGMSASFYYRLHMAGEIERGKPLKFTVLRKDKKFTTLVQPVLMCDYPLHLRTTGVVNAFASGTSIIVTSAFLDSFTDQQELGVVIGHELAHNIMGHLEKDAWRSLGDKMLGRILDRWTSSNVGDMYAQLSYLNSSLDFEYEADYVGLYLAARAGMDFERAPNMFRKMAMLNPSGISRNTTHPMHAARLVAQEAAVSEIRKKIALGQPLIPEFKGEEDTRPKNMRDTAPPVILLY